MAIKEKKKMNWLEFAKHYQFEYTMCCDSCIWLRKDDCSSYAECIHPDREEPIEVCFPKEVCCSCKEYRHRDKYISLKKRNNLSTGGIDMDKSKETIEISLSPKNWIKNLKISSIP